jgi:hypothetical protein
MPDTICSNCSKEHPVRYIQVAGLLWLKPYPANTQDLGQTRTNHDRSEIIIT